jgi:hypothetical protein
MQIGGQPLWAAVRVLDGLDEHGDGFLSRRQRDCGQGRAPDGLLAGSQGRIRGEIDVEPLIFFALQGGMLMELPEEGTRIQTQVLAQLGGGESAGRLENQGHDGLRQVAMAGKADITVKPKPVLIELRQFGQGVEATIVIKAGQGTPIFKPPTESAEGGFELFLEFGQGDDILSPPAPEQRGGRILRLPDLAETDWRGIRARIRDGPEAGKGG